MQKVLDHIGGNYVLYFWDVFAFLEDITNEDLSIFYEKMKIDA